jgi:hypothetical protein
MDKQTQIELEAATFRRLLKHLDSHKEAQNIDLMILASFCRNCLAKWYRSEAEEKGLEIDYPAAQELIYGMPYSEWKSKYQAEVTDEKLASFAEVQKKLAEEEG